MANPHLHRLISGNGNDLKRKVSAWIWKLISIDERAGRSQKDFPPVGLEAKMNEDRESFAKDGIGLFQGSGNIFLVIYKFQDPVIVHSRPLAQRVVRLKFQ